jgi:hypothetical protein
MTTLALTHGPDRLKTALTALAHIFTGIGDGLDMAREYEALTRLTPGELAERGLARADIPRVVARRLIAA